MSPLETIFREYWHLITALIAAAVLYSRTEFLSKQNAASISVLHSEIKEVRDEHERDRERLERRLSVERKEMQDGFDKIDSKLDTLRSQLIAQLVQAIRANHKE